MVKAQEKKAVIQWKRFSKFNRGKEMNSLKAKKEIPKSCEMLQFSPFLDEEVLIRPKRRIGKSQLDFNVKHETLETSRCWIILAKLAQGKSTRGH